MPDLQLYQHLLGWSGLWEVGRVTLQREAQAIEVAVRWLETVGLPDVWPAEAGARAGGAALGTGELLGSSWAAAAELKQRAVVRGLVRKSRSAPARRCVDEQSAGRGQNYLTIVARVAAGRSATVETVGAGRKREPLAAYWQRLTPALRPGVEAVGMALVPYRKNPVQDAQHFFEHVVFNQCLCGSVRKSESGPTFILGSGYAGLG